MRILDESTVCLKGIKYTLRKAKATEGEGAILVVDEPHRVSEVNFLPTSYLEALTFLLAQPKAKAV